MNAWNTWIELIAKRLSAAAGTSVSPAEIVVPPDATLGDFAYGCFKLAKEKKANPAQIAQEIAKSVDAKGLGSVTAAGPYVNIRLSTAEAVNAVVKDIEKAKKAYGSSKIGDKNGKWLFEYANPNTHKELHIGHLRNITLGVALTRLFSRAGYHAEPISYINDVGSNVGKCLWYLVAQEHHFDIRQFKQRQMKELLSSIPKEKKNGNYLGLLYAKATMSLEDKVIQPVPGTPNAEQIEEHNKRQVRRTEEVDALKEQVSFVQQKLEEHDPVWEQLWKVTRSWCLAEMKTIFNELGVKIHKQFFESEILDRSHIVVEDLLRKNIAKVSEGAVIVDLEDEKLGILVLRKTDGTLLYAAKDLALAEKKLKVYPKITQSFVLVDYRQSLYFKQVAATLRRMKVSVPFSFIGYEIVTLKEGVMSSRKGNVITYQAFRDAALDFARKEIRARHADWSAKKIEDIAWKLALGGIKFAFLKQDSDKIITFDLEQALSFDGATGPYCQYAAVRLGSILRKAGKSSSAKKSAPFEHESEKRLALKLAAFPAVVEQAAKEMRPNVVAMWCHEAAQVINDFYRDVPVLDAEASLRAGRLRLAAAAKSALEQALALLGIDVPQEM